ncbi:SNF2 family N-terminal domain-containing protein [Trichoderma gracile]
MVSEKTTEGKQEESLFVEETMEKDTLHTPQSTKGSLSADLSQPGDDVEQRVASMLPLLTAGEVDAVDAILPSDYEFSEPEAGFAEDDDSDEVEYSDVENNADYEDVSEEEDDSDFELESDASSSGGEEHQQKPAKKASKTEAKKPRRKPAMNAREFVARLHEEEDRRYAKKMEKEEKRNAYGFNSSKRRASDSSKAPFKALKMRTDDTPSMFSSIPSTSDDDPLLPMEPIKATTHAKQFAQMKAQIPNNSDTRRRSSQEKDLRQAAKLFGYKRVEAENGRWKLKGMETGLENYQLTAVAWMVKRELSRLKPFGGLLADAMGMGKTMMSLACIVGNQADAEHKKEFCNATLVVVPNKTFGKQWEDEARRHCKSPVRDRVWVYDRHDSHLTERCKKSFIVITTYHELIGQYPSKDTIKEIKGTWSGDNASIKRAVASHLGPIFKIRWYRIILDEAHAIKNPDSTTTQACWALSGKYRWALTGTPLANKAEEMYPYLRFTKCESTLNPRLFYSLYTVDGQVNAEFEALTAIMMYRRTLKDDFLGRKIIDLPEKKESDLLIPLSSEEQCVVKAVKDYYEGKIALLENGELDQDDYEAAIYGCDEVDEAKTEKSSPKKANAWTMRRASQVRRRQAISHTFCIERLLRYSFEPEELGALIDALQKIDTPKETFFEQIRAIMDTDNGISNYDAGLRILQQRDEAMFGQYFDMDKILKLTLDESSVRGITCRLCKKATPPVDPVRAVDCGHVFCSKCLCNAAKINYRKDNQEVLCPYENCNAMLEVGDDICTLQSQIDLEDKRGNDPSRDSNNATVHLEDDRNGFFLCGLLAKGASLVPSTRLTATMAVVLTWLEQAPDDKILIFTQFKGTAKILGCMLRALKIGFVYYYGGLPLGQKRKALESIRTNAEIKIMVCFPSLLRILLELLDVSTLKAGGQCLNLTVANRVVIIDPWWNKTAEQQAFGRVTRIGQEKITHLVNIRIKEEVDEYVHELQIAKAKKVDYTLQDDGHTPPTVSELELQRAFEKNKEEQEKKKKGKDKKKKERVEKAKNKKNKAAGAQN